MKRLLAILFLFPLVALAQPSSNTFTEVNITTGLTLNGTRQTSWPAGAGIVGTVSNNVASAGLLAVDASKTNGIAATAAHITNAWGIFTGDGSKFVGLDGLGHAQSGGGNVTATSLTTGVIPKASGATAIADGPIAVSATTNVTVTGKVLADSLDVTNGISSAGTSYLSFGSGAVNSSGTLNVATLVVTNLATVGSVSAGTNVTGAAGVFTNTLNSGTITAATNFVGEGGGITLANDATNSVQAVRLSQLQNLLPSSSTYYLYGSSNAFAASFGVGTTSNTNYCYNVPSSGSANTMTVNAVTTSQYLVTYVTADTFKAIGAGSINIDFYASFNSGAGRACSLVAEIYVLDTVANSLVVEYGTPVAQAITGSSVEYVFTVAATNYTSANPLRLVAKIKVASQANNPNVSIVTENGQASHIDFNIPSSSFVLKSGDTMTGALIGTTSTMTTVNDATVNAGALNVTNTATIATAHTATETVGTLTVTNAVTALTITTATEATANMATATAGTLTVTNGSTLAGAVTAPSIAVTNNASVGGTATIATSAIATATIGTLTVTNGPAHIKTTKYLYIGQGWNRLSGTGCVLVNTNDVTAVHFMVPQFSGDATTGVTNQNFVRFVLAVPADIDTSVDLTATLKFELGGADTAAHTYHIGMVSVADSAAADATAANYVTLSFAGDASGASGDIETIGATTLTNWKSNVTASQYWVIQLDRLGSDTSTVNSWLRELVIAYGSTQ